MEFFEGADKIEKTVESVGPKPSAASSLGVQGNMEDDSLGVYSGAKTKVPGKIAQHMVVSFVASVFDPLVFLAPFTM